MAILSRVRLHPAQRFDLEDYLADQAAHRADSKLWTQKFLSESNLILSGFTVSGIGLNEATVTMTGSALIIPQNSFDFSYFVAAPAEPVVEISDADLVDGARNYLEVELATQDGTPLTRAFWDSEANSGDGSEFNQIVNTITDLAVNFVVSTGGFSGSVDRLPIAIIDTDGSGVIKVILDRREMFGRLAKPNDLDNEYSWGTKVDPTFTLNMTGVSGTFIAGEEISIGSETATVVTGGGATIAFNEPTGINFGNGDSVTGATSGATGTVNTVAESFTGVDKSLNGQKEINDAIMTEIKLLKNTRFWWESSPTLGGLKNEVQSVIAPLTSGARIKWDGSNLAITDDDLTPATTDNVAAIRIFSSSFDLNLRRQDDGKEVVTITVPEIPDDGILTLDQDGNSIAIGWDDDTAAIQSSWDGSGAYAATISGSLAARRIVITANAAGDQVDVAEDSNTLEKSGSPVAATIAVKQGLASDSTIAIDDGQVLYVDLPSPLAAANYSGVGSGASNYKVADRGDLSITDTSYWLAYREGAKLVWRFVGELAAGESSEISDNVPQSLLDSIGLASETSLPSYDSDIRGVVQESIVKRVGALTDVAGDYQEDRSGYIRSDDVVTWTGSELQFAEDLILEFINTKDGSITQHVVDSAESPIQLNDGESAWILIDREESPEICTVQYSDSDAIPAQTQPNKDVFVLFRRVDADGVGYLHIPFHKQVLDAGQSVRLGASGSGSGASLVADCVFTTALEDVGGTANNAYNATATTLTKSSNGAFPSAIAHTLASNGTDGVTLILGSIVLLQNEANPDNNGLYEITTLGSGAAPWVLTRHSALAQMTQFVPGVSIFILNGNFFQYSSFVLTAAVATLGTDSVLFAKKSGESPVAYPSGSSTSVSASGTIPIAQYHRHQVIRVSGNGAAVTTASAPFGTSGAAPLDGMLLTLIGESDSNSVTIPFADTSRGCILNGDMELYLGGTLTLRYDAFISRFVEQSRS